MGLTGLQCKMARAALDLGVRDLAQVADVSPNTIARLERGESLHARTQVHIRGALEAAGVRILDIGAGSFGGGAGVRLDDQSKSGYANLFERLWTIPDMRQEPRKALSALIGAFSQYLDLIAAEGREPDTWERLDLNDALIGLAKGNPFWASAYLRHAITPPDNQSSDYPISDDRMAEAEPLSLKYFRDRLERLKAVENPLVPKVV